MPWPSSWAERWSLVVGTIWGSPGSRVGGGSRVQHPGKGPRSLTKAQRTRRSARSLAFVLLGYMRTGIGMVGCRISDGRDSLLLCCIIKKFCDRAPSVSHNAICRTHIPSVSSIVLFSTLLSFGCHLNQYINPEIRIFLLDASEGGARSQELTIDTTRSEQDQRRLG